MNSAIDWRTLGRALLEAAAQPTMVLDSEGCVRECNWRLCELLGAARDDLTGQALVKLCTTRSEREFAHDRISDALAGRLARAEITVSPDRRYKLALTLHFQRFDGAAGAPVLLARVTSIRRSPGWTAAHFPGDRLYEISASRTDFGTILFDSNRDEPCAQDVVGRRCFVALANNRAPCSGCPAYISARPGDVRTGVVTYDSNPHLMSLVTAEFTALETIRVSRRSVTDRDVRDLVSAKIERLVSEAGLSDKERKVVELITEGAGTAQIAELLDIAPRTVKFHQTNALRKLGVESRNELLRLLL